MTDTPASPTIGGIHISRGVTLRIPTGGLVLGSGLDGRGAQVVAVELQLDTCVHWLDIALEQLGLAKNAHTALTTSPFNGMEWADPLDREFKAGMQAAVAAASFFEALYAATVWRTPKPPKIDADKGRTRPRTARYKRVTEQLRQAFGLKTHATENLRSVLIDIYRFRDEAVHPSSAFSTPVLHPDLNVGVERRFVMFGYTSAQKLVHAALTFSKILPSHKLGNQPQEMRDFAAYLLKVCEPLHIMWETTYGPLIYSDANS